MPAGLQHPVGDAAGEILLEEGEGWRTTCQWFCQCTMLVNETASEWLTRSRNRIVPKRPGQQDDPRHGK